MKLRKNKKGFTIVELVIVIGVIGILSAILIPTFVNLTDNANKAALKSNLANAYSLYAADAADGYVGEPSSTGTKLVFRGQESVALSETKLDAGTEKSAFLYTVADGWGTDKTSGLEVVASLTTAAQTGKYLLTAEEMYGGYYVYYKLLETDKA